MSVEEQILAELRKLTASTRKPAYSAAEAGELLGGLSESTVRQMVADGELRKVPGTGRRIIIADREIRRFLGEDQEDVA